MPTTFFFKHVSLAHEMGRGTVCGTQPSLPSGGSFVSPSIADISRYSGKASRSLAGLSPKMTNRAVAATELPCNQRIV